MNVFVAVNVGPLSFLKTNLLLKLNLTLHGAHGKLGFEMINNMMSGSELCVLFVTIQTIKKPVKIKEERKEERRERERERVREREREREKEVNRKKKKKNEGMNE